MPVGHWTQPLELAFEYAPAAHTTLESHEDEPGALEEPLLHAAQSPPAVE